MRQRLGIGSVLVASVLMVAAVALLVGCGPAVQAEAADQSPFGNGINPAAYFDLHTVREMGAMGLQHSGESTVTVAYTATFSVRGPVGLPRVRTNTFALRYPTTAATKSRIG